MAQIGRKGFRSLTDRYFAGDRQQAGDWLRTGTHERRPDSFVDREMARRMKPGGIAQMRTRETCGWFARRVEAFA